MTPSWFREWHMVLEHCPYTNLIGTRVKTLKVHGGLIDSLV